jgi:hypothetical protein
MSFALFMVDPVSHQPQLTMKDTKSMKKNYPRT